MTRYIYCRLLLLFPTLVGLSILSFFLIHLAPGGPLERRLQGLRTLRPLGAEMNAEISKQVEQRLIEQYGFNKPLMSRYGEWIGRVIRFDFGESLTYQDSAARVIFSKAKVSLAYGLAALLLTYVLAIPLGVAQALRENSCFDWGTSLLLILIFSAPPLVIGLFLRALLSAAPVVEEASTFKSSAVVLCYALSYLALLTFLMKNSLLEEIRLDYVQLARAKGASEKRVVAIHALRNALIPLIAGFSYFVGIFFAGSLVVERVFNVDGLGYLSYTSAMNRDYSVLMALVVLQSFLMIAAKFLGDLLYVAVDPRIQLS